MLRVGLGEPRDSDHERTWQGPIIGCNQIDVKRVHPSTHWHALVTAVAIRMVALHFVVSTYAHPNYIHQEENMATVQCH